MIWYLKSQNSILGGFVKAKYYTTVFRVLLHTDCVIYIDIFFEKIS